MTPEEQQRIEDQHIEKIQACLNGGLYLHATDDVRFLLTLLSEREKRIAELEEELHDWIPEG